MVLLPTNLYIEFGVLGTPKCQIWWGKDLKICWQNCDGKPAKSWRYETPPTHTHPPKIMERFTIDI